MGGILYFIFAAFVGGALIGAALWSVGWLWRLLTSPLKTPE